MKSAIQNTILETYGKLQYLTIYEWLHFAIIHTQRHAHQLKSIYEHIKKQ